MEEIIFFHNEIMFVLSIIITVVLWLIVKALINGYYYKFLIEGTLVEIVWTIIPAIILLFIAFPSLKLLYIMDEPSITVKVVGHQ